MIACQPFVMVSRHLPTATSGEIWQLVAGLEAALILVLFLGWLNAAWRKPNDIEDDREESP